MDRYLPLCLPVFFTITALNLHFCTCTLHYLPDSLASPADDASSLLAVHPQSQRSASWRWTSAASRVARRLHASSHVILDHHAMAIASMRDLCKDELPRSSHSIWRPTDVQAAI